MTKKHFQAVADAIKSERAIWAGDKKGENALLGITEALAREFKSINPRFDRARFMAACGF